MATSPSSLMRPLEDSAMRLPALAVTEAPRRSLSFGQVFWAVVLGNMVTGALGLLIYAGMSKP